MDIIESFDLIRDILGTPNPATYQKIQPCLNARMMRFVEKSPLAMFATVDAEGFPTISPKGDEPGFIKVRDARTLLLPERKGNKLAFSLENLMGHPEAALILMIPGTPETLRIHGRCRVIRDEVLNRELASATQDALLVMEMSVVKCYFQCAKAFLRSKAWSPESWGPREKVSFGEEIFGTSADARDAAQSLDSGVDERYKTDL